MEVENFSFPGECAMYSVGSLSGARCVLGRLGSALVVLFLFSLEGGSEFCWVGDAMVLL